MALFLVEFKPFFLVSVNRITSSCPGNNSNNDSRFIHERLRLSDRSYASKLVVWNDDDMDHLDKESHTVQVGRQKHVVPLTSVTSGSSCHEARKLN